MPAYRERAAAMCQAALQGTQPESDPDAKATSTHLELSTDLMPQPVLATVIGHTQPHVPVEPTDSTTGRWILLLYFILDPHNILQPLSLHQFAYT